LVPAAWEFVQRGVPDVLFTGDGAALELRVLQAGRGVQFLGPYSLFGWSHPGPAYFYLALPFYELFGERGPALNLFALVVNGVAAVARVLITQRLLGFATAIAAAALVSVFVSVIGLIAWIVFAAWTVRIVERRFGGRARLIVGFPAVVVMALTLIGGPARPPVFREPDPATETLARDVESFLRTSRIEQPLVRIDTRDAWPAAVAVVLHLFKRGVPLYVEDEWLYVVGRQFAAPPGAHREVHFANRTSVEEVPAPAIVSRAAGREDLLVYLTP
jgi:hypothetical protein